MARSTSSLILALIALGTADIARADTSHDFVAQLSTGPAIHSTARPARAVAGDDRAQALIADLSTTGRHNPSQQVGTEAPASDPAQAFLAGLSTAQSRPTPTARPIIQQAAAN